MAVFRPITAQAEPEPPLWEQLAAGFVVIMLTGALIGPVFAPDQGETPLLRLIWLPVYATIAGLIVIRFDKVVRVWPAWIALLAMVALAFASKYWSLAPDVTVRRVIAMTINASFAVYLGAVFRGVALPRLLVHAVLPMALGSLVMVFAFPSIGVHSDINAGLWRGLWYEKNQMGIVMVAGAVGAAAVLATGDRRWHAPVAVLPLATLLVLTTQSKTSLICMALGLGIIGGLWILRRSGPAAAVGLVWLGVVAVAGGVAFWFAGPEIILEALGKDPTLTGRTEIWESLMRRVGDRPMTGYGYSAFWGLQSTPANFVRLETGWVVPSAHNGWIDLLVQLGWPGAVLVGIILGGATLLTVCRIGGAGAREGDWGLAYMAVFILLSLSESVLMSHAGLPWSLALAIVARSVAPGRIGAPYAQAVKSRAARQGRLRSNFQQADTIA